MAEKEKATSIIWHDAPHTFRSPVLDEALMSPDLDTFAPFEKAATPPPIKNKLEENKKREDDIHLPSGICSTWSYQLFLTCWIIGRRSLDNLCFVDWCLFHDHDDPRDRHVQNGVPSNPCSLSNHAVICCPALVLVGSVPLPCCCDCTWIHSRRRKKTMTTTKKKGTTRGRNEGNLSGAQSFPRSFPPMWWRRKTVVPFALENTRRAKSYAGHGMKNVTMPFICHVWKNGCLGDPNAPVADPCICCKMTQHHYHGRLQV
eukprot:scaffold5605_cov128-Cylindrotheca_fusiformis.AAC.14